jgi:hypothetical protein
MAAFLDELRTERNIVIANATLDVPVPPSARIVVRCRPPHDRSKLDEIVTAYRAGVAPTGDQELQLLVDVCEEILARDPDTGEIAPFDDDGPLRFDASDERWGDDVQTARECVSKLFQLDVKPLALTGPATVIIDWLQGIVHTGLQRVEGKSPGAAGS